MKFLIVSSSNLESTKIREKTNNSKEIFHLTCGVGIPLTIYNLTKELNNNKNTKYDLIINAGICGSFNKKIKIGDTGIIKKDIFGDLGISSENNFELLYKSSLIKKKEQIFEMKFTKNEINFLKKNNIKLFKSITLNTVSGKEEDIKKNIKKFNCDIETMEGAGFHLVCEKFNLKSIQIRTVSNMITSRNKNDWNIDLALENLTKSLNLIIDFYKKNK